MPQHDSAKKRMRTNERDRTRNRATKSQVRRAVKDLDGSLGSDESGAALQRAQSVLDKAWKKGVLNRSKVNRMKSRLAKRESDSRE